MIYHFRFIAILLITVGTVCAAFPAVAQSLPASLDEINSIQDETDGSMEEEREEGDVPFIPVATEIIYEGDHDEEVFIDNNIDINDNSVSLYDADRDDDIKLPNPLYQIHDIRVMGNMQTSSNRILSIMNIREGDQIRLDELEEARIRLAVSGAFESVEVKLNSRGSLQLDIEIYVVERSNMQINNYWIGTSEKSPFWLGLDVTWLAPFSKPHRLRWAFGATSSDDYSLDVSYLIPTISHLPVSLMFEIQSMQSHEGVYAPFGMFDRTTPIRGVERYTHAYDLNFRKNGISAGVGYSPREFLRLLLKINYSHLHRLDNTHRDHQPPMDPFMEYGRTHMPNVSFIVSYDSRARRMLPDGGHFVSLGIRGTFKSAISDYSYIRANIVHQSNFNPSPHHVIRLNSFAGVHYGNAPFFERFFYNDFYTFAPSRFLGINPSSQGALDLFKTGTSSLSYEDFLVDLTVTYAWQPRQDLLELFVSAGVTWADSLNKEPLSIGMKPMEKRGSFPIDMSLNGGVRFVTPYGLVSLTLAHILNLFPR